MTKEEFLKLVMDFASAQAVRDKGWRYRCFNMMSVKYQNGRDEIRIQFSPYKVEEEEPKEIKLK